jgi:hypothetical protein
LELGGVIAPHTPTWFSAPARNLMEGPMYKAIV